MYRWHGSFAITITVMKKWFVYLLGVISGIVLTFAFAYYANLSDNSGIIGLEMFEEPGDCMEYSQFEVLQVGSSGCALAEADESFGTIVLIIPDENQQFYDNQKIVLESNRCARHVGTYRYTTNMGMEKTVPAVMIVDGVETAHSDEAVTDEKHTGKTLFDEPGECVSRKNFEVQEVLESGDAIALEVEHIGYGYVLTSDLEVLIPAREGSHFYDKQIIKTPKGKCARQIGNYKYQRYGDTKVIPIVAFE